MRWLTCFNAMTTRSDFLQYLKKNNSSRHKRIGMCKFIKNVVGNIFTQKVLKAKAWVKYTKIIEEIQNYHLASTFKTFRNIFKIASKKKNAEKEKKNIFCTRCVPTKLKKKKKKNISQFFRLWRYCLWNCKNHRKKKMYILPTSP